MTTVAWTKTILKACRHVKTVCLIVDSYVRHSPKRIFRIFGEKNTVFHIDKILRLSEAKERAIRLAHLCSGILSKMKPGNKEVLFQKFLLELPDEVIIKKLGKSRRSMYRCLDKSLKEFTFLRGLGQITDEELLKEYGGDEWITKIHKNFAA